ncbi:class I SAM-dependent methyltransferase [Duganella sp. Root198D2]|uniref:class I SAM-dependent methyltransferase n=1 Tax=Duganella sp. Root198D2 TaxID=1736489 RepID=UPI00070AB04F|nr:class I SAM-dependent methyltransferase [Duganella sp. Root198D2]KRB81727.1 methylase [Duganella sp. Root198D2]
MPPKRSLLRIPAFQALLAQAGAMLPCAALAVALESFGHGLTMLQAVLLQGLFAAAIGWKIGLARWWLPILLLFPIALLAGLALHLPPWLAAAVFLVLLGWYWSTYRTQVPYYPSSRAVWRAVLAELPQGRALRMIDIGSGLGGFALHLARARPESEVVGIELAPVPWLVSRLRAAFCGSRARFVRGDYEQLNFAEYDLVFAYLSPAAMPALWNKAQSEMRGGSLLASYEFEIPAANGIKTIRTTEGGPPLYIRAF